MIRKLMKANTRVPPARPSNPSVRFTPLLQPTMARMATAMKKMAPSSTLRSRNGMVTAAVNVTSPTNGTRTPLNPKWFWT
jgi:hypothetical protein